MKINEIFGPTIQGEGKSVGKAVIFIRLSMCNLHCVWCDTPYTWNWKGTNFLHPLKFNRDKETHEMSLVEIVQKVRSLGNTKAVVISGGEPLLQQKELINLVSALKAFGYWVEIETNGTMVLMHNLTKYVDQINCSPKLENSGNDFKLRRRPEALKSLTSCGKANFKFVVTCDDDIKEILELVHTFQMKEVYLMPEGTTKEQLAKHEDATKVLCEKYGFNYSPRVHIIELGGGRGV